MSLPTTKVSAPVDVETSVDSEAPVSVLAPSEEVLSLPQALREATVITAAKPRESFFKKLFFITLSSLCDNG